ncbi:MAG: plasma-membrane proton-efflux P-type ATPase [Candidatus Kryptoniota bacterium]
MGSINRTDSMSTSSQLKGLTSADANVLLHRYGPNLIRQKENRPFIDFLKKLWGPIPWMLEVSIIIELALGKSIEGTVILALLIFNAITSTIQEKRSQDALALLKKQLQLTARVLRDGKWQTLPAEEIVPGDVLYIRLGDLIPADVRIIDGQVSLDQSALTGESLPVNAGPGQYAYTGTTVKHGEASAEVISTGIHTKFGKTAELVSSARTKSHLEEIVLGIVKYLIIFDIILAAIVFFYSIASGIQIIDILPFILILIVASVPVALPTTFTIASSLGARDLSHRGVLVTHLTAIEEAAGMDTLCSDKTGTITENKLAVSALKPYAPYDETDLLKFALMSSDEATQDPIDMSILEYARKKNALSELPTRLKFVPFDPETKRSEAYYKTNDRALRVAKGAPVEIAKMCENISETFKEDEDELAQRGYRVLAVAVGNESTYNLAGLVALHDPPRTDSRSLISRLRGLGIRVMMVTGDGLETAKSVAAEVGIGNRVCHSDSLQSTSDYRFQDCDVFAEVLPEHKFQLVQLLQKSGHTVGMTGDGVNDAPALKQAQVGIAVSNATDVAKAAASIVLTEPGLTNIVSAVEESRSIYQRMLTYTLNKIVKTINVVLFLSLGLMLTHTLMVTPLLIILMMFANDFATMSIATDRVIPSQRPDRWNVGAIIKASIVLGTLVLVLSFLIFLMGKDIWHLSNAQLQTLNFVTLVYSGQATIYLVRERKHFWRSRPSKWLLGISVADVVAVAAIAHLGILMVGIPLTIIITSSGIILLYLFFIDYVKYELFARLNLH